MSNTTIADAIARAQAAAAEIHHHNVNQRMPVVMPAQNAVAAPMPAGPPLGLDDMLAGGVAVDHWLKVTPYGLTVGDRTRPIDAIDVYLDMGEIAYNYAIKYTVNGQAIYHKSYDRVTDARGGSWMASLQKAQAIDPNAYEYRSAELPFMAASDIVGKDGKTMAAHEGDRLGLALATTAWTGFERFIRDIRRRGIDPTTTVLRLTLGTQAKQKTGVNDWGVPTFANVEAVEALPTPETRH
ncbi:hypothetical protein [Ensifer soli]|uniref:hypothetical protein n=1 Tax=Ciceribacter sp. sgz301302 TaxID=3342379 RepID=UPI0035B9EA0F